MKTMFLIADFCADYPGNFIASVLSLENKLLGQVEIVYFFRNGNAPGFRKWMKAFSKNRECHPNSFDKAGCEALVRLVKEKKPSYLYFHFGGLLFPYMVYRRMNRHEKKTMKFVYHVHSKPNQDRGLKSKIKHFASRFLCPKSLVFIACSEEIEQILAKAYRKRKIYLNQNKIDFSRLAFHPGKKASFGAKANAITFCYDYYIKGGDIAAAIAKKLHEKYPSFRLLMVVARSEGSIRERLESDFPDYADFIDILPPSNDVAKIYELSSIYLLCSRTEGLSYAMVEASYSGLTVVCSDLPALKGVKLPRLKTFPVGDADAGADLVEQCFYEEPQITEKAFFKDYDLEAWSDKEAEIFMEIDYA